MEVWTPVFRFTSHARPSPGTEGSPGVLRPMIATRRTCDFQFSLFAIWGVDLSGLDPIAFNFQPHGSGP